MSNPGKLRLAPLVAAIYFCVCGGPYGLEPVMKSGAGMGLLLILVTPILWGLPIALMTAELASAIPSEGGYYVWVKRAMGPFAGFLCGWWTWVYSWVDAALYPTMFARYLATLIGEFGGKPGFDSNPELKWLAGLVIIVPLTWLNVRGAKLVGGASMAFMGILLIPFAAMVVMGLGHAFGHPPTGFVAAGQTAQGAFGAGLFVIMWNYLGWDSMSTVAGEVDNPRRSFPLALGLAAPLVIGSYLLPAYVGVSFLRDVKQWEEGAWTVVAHAIGGPGLAVGVAFGGMLGACGLFGATLLASSRIPMVLAADGYLPKALSREHAKFGTPVAAVLVSAAVYTVLSYQRFQMLAALDVVMYSAAVVLEFWALLTLRRREPELARPYRVPGGWPVLAFLASAPFVLVLFAFYSQYRDPDDGGLKFVLLAAAGLLSGPIVFFASRRFRGSVTFS